MKYINLYTKDLSSKRWPENFYFNILLAGSTALTLIYFVMIIFNFLGFQFISSKNKKLETEKQQLIIKEQQFNNMVSELSRLRGDKKALTDIISTVETLSRENVIWSGLVKNVSKNMNESVWIDSFTTNVIPGITNNADIHLNGGALNLKSLNNFVKNLENEYGNLKISLRESENEKLKFSYYSFSLTFIYSGEKK